MNRQHQEIITNLMDPHPHDVLCGRGAGILKWPGNKRWRELIKEKQEEYLQMKKHEKIYLTQSIVFAVRSLSPPGKFLAKDDRGRWYEIGDQKANEKTAQALREGAPKRRKGLPESSIKSAPPLQQQASPPSFSAPMHFPVEQLLLQLPASPIISYTQETHQKPQAVPNSLKQSAPVSQQQIDPPSFSSLLLPVAHLRDVTEHLPASESQISSYIHQQPQEFFHYHPKAMNEATSMTKIDPWSTQTAISTEVTCGRINQLEGHDSDPYRLFNDDMSVLLDDQDKQQLVSCADLPFQDRDDPPSELSCDDVTDEKLAAAKITFPEPRVVPAATLAKLLEKQQQLFASIVAKGTDVEKQPTGDSSSDDRGTR